MKASMLVPTLWIRVDRENIMLQTVDPLSSRMTKATSLSSTAWETSQLNLALT
jgi:hypothetical protein